MKFHDNCLICNSKKIVGLIGYEKDFLGKCKDCGLVFSMRIPTKEELEKYYEVYSYEAGNYLSPVTTKRYDEILDEFEPFRKSNKILDVGCGSGLFLLHAKKRGWQVYGTEFSDAAVRNGRELGITIYPGELNANDFESADFDIITSFEVIEHLNNPVYHMQQIAMLLRSGGVFYLTTPNFNGLLRFILKGKYNVVCYPEHLCYYTPSTMNLLLKKVGLKKKKLITTGISLTRLRTSLSLSNQAMISEKSDDEKLRVRLESSTFLKLAKSAANFVFKTTATGLTIKATYTK